MKREWAILSWAYNPSIPCVLVTVNLSKKPLYGPGETFESENGPQLYMQNGLYKSLSNLLVKRRVLVPRTASSPFFLQILIDEQAWQATRLTDLADERESFLKNARRFSIDEI